MYLKHIILNIVNKLAYIAVFNVDEESKMIILKPTFSETYISMPIEHVAFNQPILKLIDSVNSAYIGLLLGKSNHRNINKKFSIIKKNEKVTFLMIDRDYFIHYKNNINGIIYSEDALEIFKNTRKLTELFTPEQAFYCGYMAGKLLNNRKSI